MDKKQFMQKLLLATLVIFIFAAVMGNISVGIVIIAFFKLFAPIFIGSLIALVLYKPLKKTEGIFFKLRDKSKAKKKPSDKLISTVSLVLIVIFALLILLFVGNIVIPQIAASFINIASAIETYFPKLIAKLEKWDIDTSDIKALLAKIDIDAIIETIKNNAGNIFNTAVGAVTGIASAAVTAFSSIIFSIYLLSYRHSLKRQTHKLLLAYFKPSTAKRLNHIVSLTVSAFSNFFSGQCLEAIILGSIFFVTMSVFGFPYAVVISVIIAITAFIPYVGSFIGCAVGVLLIMMQNPMRALIFLAMFLVIQQIENNLIYPRVVGTSVNLPAIWTFTAIIVGGAIFGVSGMIFFIPLTSVIYTLLKENVNHRINLKFSDTDDLESKFYEDD